MFLYNLFRSILLVLCKLFFHLEVRGKERIPKGGGFLLVSNHASLLDPILLGVSSPRELNFAAKDALFRNYFLGGLIKRVGAFAVKRWSADLSAVRESIRRLGIGYGLVVFPEGTRSPDGRMRDFSYGFVFLAKKAGVPIVPAYLSGSFRALGKGSKMVKPAKIRVFFGEPVYPKLAQSNEDVAKAVLSQIKSLSCS